MTRIHTAAILMVLTACTINAPADGWESLEVGTPEGTKVELTDGMKSVWNSGDELSVFVDGGGNERWSYTGADKSKTGTISHLGPQREIASAIAVYPYNEAATLSGGFIHTSVQGNGPVLFARSDSSSLRFSYANSAVRIKFDRTVNLSSLIISGNGGETLSGTCSIDASTGSLSMEGDGSATVSTSGNADRFTLFIPPVAFASGFTVSATYSNGQQQTLKYTDAIQFHGGEILELQAYGKYSTAISLDFREKALADFPTSMTHEDNTYKVTIEGAEYEFGFHAGYYEYPEGHAQAGVQAYGYEYYTCKYVTPNCNCLLIGRSGSWIKLPAIQGKAITGISFTAGNTGSGRYLSADAEGNEAVSESLSSFTPGEEYSLDVNYFKRADDQPLYLFFSGNGNHLLLTLTVYYL